MAGELRERRVQPASISHPVRAQSTPELNLSTYAFCSGFKSSPPWAYYPYTSGSAGDVGTGVKVDLFPTVDPSQYWCCIEWSRDVWRDPERRDRNTC